MKQHTLQADHLTAGYGNRIILDDLNISIPGGKTTVILGSNGCGKSTFLKSMSRLIRPDSGAILLDHKDIADYPTRQLAQIIGLLPQSPTVPEGIRVAELVARGRFPYQKFMQSATEEDYRIVEKALEMLNISHLADYCVDELSGGQRQRVWIALALAQNTDILLLDEPTTYLDIAYQIEILDVLKELNRKHRVTVVMVLHDINQSVRYADHIIAMKDGHVVAEGEPAALITPELLDEIYGLKCQVFADPVEGKPWIIPNSKA